MSRHMDRKRSNYGDREMKRSMSIHCNRVTKISRHFDRNRSKEMDEVTKRSRHIGRERATKMSRHIYRNRNSDIDEVTKRSGHMKRDRKWSHEARTREKEEVRTGRERAQDSQNLRIDDAKEGELA